MNENTEVVNVVKTTAIPPEQVLPEHQRPGFWAIHTNELKKFLIESIQHCYGDAGAEITLLDDGGYQQNYWDRDWTYKDVWYGGEPFSGMTTVAYHDIVCWAMSYHGLIRDDEHRDSILNSCLRPALRHPDPKYPWRGPLRYVSENGLYVYAKTCKPAKLGHFAGKEIIRDPNQTIVYRATFQGGFVDYR